MDALGTAAAYQPGKDQWVHLPDVPQDPGECRPRSAPVGDRVLVHLCRGIVSYDAASSQWQDISHRRITGWWAELVAAGPVVIVLAKDVPGGGEAMLAYRPEQ